MKIIARMIRINPTPPPTAPPTIAPMLVWLFDAVGLLVAADEVRLAVLEVEVEVVEFLVCHPVTSFFDRRGGETVTLLPLLSVPVLKMRVQVEAPSLSQP